MWSNMAQVLLTQVLQQENDVIWEADKGTI
jgi:hypothetical protein